MIENIYVDIKMKRKPLTTYIFLHLKLLKTQFNVNSEPLRFLYKKKQYKTYWYTALKFFLAYLNVYKVE